MTRLDDDGTTYTITDGNADIDRQLARVLRYLAGPYLPEVHSSQIGDIHGLADLLDERATERERRLTAGLTP